MTPSMLHRLVAVRHLTDTGKWRVPADESVPRPPRGYIISFVVFHQRSFSIPTE
jgi:hypothetical protein